MKKALITGITGQDGSYLAELLLNKGYEVHGIKRRASSFNTQRIDHLYQDPHENQPNFFLHYGDLTDSTNLIRIIQQIRPDELYNLGAQSHVAVSFDTPEYTANCDALGTLRILEAIRILGLKDRGTLKTNSIADISIYDPNKPIDQMFRNAEYVFKNGVEIVKKGKVLKYYKTSTKCLEINYDFKIHKNIRDWFDNYYSLSLDEFQIDENFFSENNFQVINKI